MQKVCLNCEHYDMAAPVCSVDFCEEGGWSHKEWPRVFDSQVACEQWAIRFCDCPECMKEYWKHISWYKRYIPLLVWKQIIGSIRRTFWWICWKLQIPTWNTLGYSTNKESKESYKIRAVRFWNVEGWWKFWRMK